MKVLKTQKNEKKSLNEALDPKKREDMLAGRRCDYEHGHDWNVAPSDNDYLVREAKTFLALGSKALTAATFDYKRIVRAVHFAKRAVNEVLGRGCSLSLVEEAKKVSKAADELMDLANDRRTGKTTPASTTTTATAAPTAAATVTKDPVIEATTTNCIICFEQSAASFPKEIELLFISKDLAKAKAKFVAYTAEIFLTDILPIILLKQTIDLPELSEGIKILYSKVTEGEYKNFITKVKTIGNEVATALEVTPKDPSIISIISPIRTKLQDDTFIPWKAVFSLTLAQGSFFADEFMAENIIHSIADYESLSTPSLHKFEDSLKLALEAMFDKYCKS